MFSRKEGRTERLCSSLDSNRIAIAAMNESTAAGTCSVGHWVGSPRNEQSSLNSKEGKRWDLPEIRIDRPYISPYHVTLTDLIRRGRDVSVLVAFKSFIMWPGVQSRNNATRPTEMINGSKNSVNSKPDWHPLTKGPKTLSFRGWHEAAKAAGKQRCL